MTILSAGPWTDPVFDASEASDFLKTRSKILVVGAGGLGCEILHNLALLGFPDIHVIDMDTVDVSNLNRQFLFRQADVGQPKAIVAARFVMNRVPGVKITPYHGKIQDKDNDYYMQFNIVICGLDSIDARRWMNATLVNMVDPDNPESLKPLIDGGTEGFRGQSRVILPTLSSCYECHMDLLPPQTRFPFCTIATTPRLPEHCIEWASMLEWPRKFPDKKLDADNPQHVQWLYDQASIRAKQYNIQGITWALTQGVVKNIIPAIASTNAIIAASCCNEAFKIATNVAPYLNNYMMYNGADKIYTYTFASERKEECPVCGPGGLVEEITWSHHSTLQELIEWLAAHPPIQAKKPSLLYGDKSLYFQNPPHLQELTAPNLLKTMEELLLPTTTEEQKDSDAKYPRLVGDIMVTDAALPFSLTLRVTLS